MDVKTFEEAKVVKQLIVKKNVEIAEVSERIRRLVAIKSRSTISFYDSPSLTIPNKYLIDCLKQFKLKLEAELTQLKKDFERI